MEKIIPASLFLIFVVFTFLFSKYWLKKYDRKNEIESIDSNRKMDFGKLGKAHIKNVKIGSLILIVVTVLKIIYLILENYFFD